MVREFFINKSEYLSVFARWNDTVPSIFISFGIVNCHICSFFTHFCHLSIQLKGLLPYHMLLWNYKYIIEREIHRNHVKWIKIPQNTSTLVQTVFFCVVLELKITKMYEHFSPFWIFYHFINASLRQHLPILYSSYAYE